MIISVFKRVVLHAYNMFAVDCISHLICSQYLLLTRFRKKPFKAVYSRSNRTIAVSYTHLTLPTNREV